MFAFCCSNNCFTRRLVLRAGLKMRSKTMCRGHSGLTIPMPEKSLTRGSRGLSVPGAQKSGTFEGG